MGAVEKEGNSDKNAVAWCCF